MIALTRHYWMMQGPVLEALHGRADELGGRFRALNTTGKMGKIKLKQGGGAAGSGSKSKKR